jgi:hypothetical protein
LVKGEVYRIPITKPTIITKYAAIEVHLNLAPDVFHKSLGCAVKIDIFLPLVPQAPSFGQFKRIETFG